MSETLLKKSEAEEIIRDNEEYTLFAWNKQKGTYGHGCFPVR